VKRLLVVDDKAFVRHAIRRVLESTTVAVDVAADTASALVELRTQLPDVMIVDVVIPGMDGVQLIRKVRTEFPTERIVAISGGGNFELSGYRHDAVATRAYLAAATDAGAQATLAKPFETAELEAVIAPLLNQPLPLHGLA
jgi:CheY-like chemotaxis protein